MGLPRLPVAVCSSSPYKLAPLCLAGYLAELPITRSRLAAGRGLLELATEARLKGYALLRAVHKPPDRVSTKRGQTQAGDVRRIGAFTSNRSYNSRRRARPTEARVGASPKES